MGLLLLSLAVACSAERQQPQAQTEPSVSEDLEPFLTSYFATWSRGDMDGYRDHFAEEAVIVMVSSGRMRTVLPLDPFVDGQAAMQREREGRATERMTGFRAHEDSTAASVTVDWLLTRGEERQVGVDRFTLIRDADGDWKIATLVFYSTD